MDSPCLQDLELNANLCVVTDGLLLSHHSHYFFKSVISWLGWGHHASDELVGRSTTDAQQHCPLSLIASNVIYNEILLKSFKVLLPPENFPTLPCVAILVPMQYSLNSDHQVQSNNLYTEIQYNRIIVSIPRVLSIIQR